MASHKSKVGEYEVDSFARRHRLTRQQVLKLIRDRGNDRMELEAAAAELIRPVCVP
ncbi:DUF3606 domain-containing protein [Chelatococcus reniformis]|uniref:DUF3606 domain-containing protein n=1 Tax=Chelatococcus reniformis TaxID=1494448 RepID=A0A916ULV0_9HYPH|nr:DUF3606 domain-containing protein [Chelatococcus reniformis]GGC76740.1 hypothetical protein GCM10010994_38800 [Chelatococcus reniformis]